MYSTNDFNITRELFASGDQTLAITIPRIWNSMTVCHHQSMTIRCLNMCLQSHCWFLVLVMLYAVVVTITLCCVCSEAVETVVFDWQMRSPMCHILISVVWTFRSRKWERLSSYHSLTLSCTNRSVLTHLAACWCLDLLDVARPCWPKPLHTTPLVCVFTDNWIITSNSCCTPVRSISNKRCADCWCIHPQMWICHCFQYPRISYEYQVADADNLQL